MPTATCNLLELKRDKTPREVVAQVLDYGSWVSTLSRDDIIDIATKHLDQPFEAAFEDVFGSAPPDELNGDLSLTIVAAELDASSERIVNYLRDFGVPVNAVFFSYLEDDGRRYLARSWLAASDDETPTATTGSKKSKRAAVERPGLVRLLRRRRPRLGGRARVRLRLRRWRRKF